jgi:two-component system alkaline phosphatase synthesis response regulator PhoP
MPELKKALFIEDDDFLRSLVVTKLQKNDFVVATSADGSNALELINQEKPDILLLDLMLPGVSGFEILKQVRESETWKNLKVIIFSNLGEEEDIRRGEELGADEYLIKSNFTLDELIEKMREIIG